MSMTIILLVAIFIMIFAAGALIAWHTPREYDDTETTDKEDREALP